MQTLPQSRLAAVDPQRVAAISGAIAINGLLAFFLIAPMATPMVRPPTEQVIDYFFPKPSAKLEPKPIRVKVKHAPSRLPPPVPRRQLETTVKPPPVVVDPQQGDITVEPADPHSVHPPPDAGPGPAVIDDGKPVMGASLEYASAPPPPYPREAVLDGVTGTVLLEVTVGADGRPTDVRIQRSSGSRQLDAAARRQVLTKWRFRPATRNGQAVPAIGLVPVEFKLD